MNPHEELAIDILHDLGQDDVGMYEVFWRANTLYPGLATVERNAIAQQAVHHLVDSGWAEVIDTQEQNEVRRDPALIDDSAWRADADPDTRYWLQITPAGLSLTRSG